MRAIVTGATSGIGAAVVRRFARDRASIAMVGRNAAALDAAMAELTGTGADVRAIVADVTETDAPSRIVATAVQAFGGLDALVNAEIGRAHV